MLSIRSFGLAMINLFLPIYFFTLRNSLFDVVALLFFTYLSMIFFFPVAAKLTSKIGAAHTMLFSAPFAVLFFGLLYFTNPLQIGIIFIGLLYGFFESFFWIGFHEEFSFASKSKKVGREVGLFRGITIMTELLGPLIGALIIAILGFHVLFAVVVLLILVCQIPLLLSKDIKPRQKFSLKSIYVKKHLTLFFPFVGNGAMNVSIRWFWPILLFLIIPTILDLGILATIVNLFCISLTLVIGYKSDKIKKIKIIKIGSILFSFSVFARAFVRTSIAAASAWIFGGIVWPLLDIPFESLTYAKSKRLNKLEFFVMREHALNIGRFVILAVAFILLANTLVALTTVLMVGGILTTFYWLVK